MQTRRSWKLASTHLVRSSCAISCSALWVRTSPCRARSSLITRRRGRSRSTLAVAGRSVQVQPVGQPQLRQREDLELFEDVRVHTFVLSGLWSEIEVVAKDRAMNTIVERAQHTR